MNVLASITLLNTIGFLGLAVFALFKRPHSALTRSFVIVNATVGIWSATFMYWQLSPDSATAEMRLRVNLCFGIWVNQTLLYFIFHLTEVFAEWRQRVMTATVLINIFLSGLCLSGYFFGPMHHWPPFGYWGTATRVLSAYLVFWHLELAGVFFLLFKRLAQTQGKQRLYMRMTIVGLAGGYLGGSPPWLLFYGINIPPYCVALVAISAAVFFYAIIRYRYIDLTLIVRKTLVYSIVTAVLSAIYMALLLMLVLFIQKGNGSVNVWFAASAGALTTFIFSPLRSRVQRTLDRLFWRSRMEWETRLTQFSTAVVEREPVAVLTLLEDVLQRTLHPVATTLYRRTDNGSFVRHSASSVVIEPSEIALKAAFEARGECLGWLELGPRRSEIPYSEEDRKFVQILAHQAAMALDRPRWVNEVGSGFAHEIKTPLANMALPAELAYLDVEQAERGELSWETIAPELKRRLQYIADQAFAAAERVEAMRADTSSRADKPVSLNQVVRRAADSLREMTQKADCTLTIDLPPALDVLANPRQLEIIFVNLIKNALEATTGQPLRRITIRAQVMGDQAQVDVQDTGPGIARTDWTRVLQPLYSTKEGRGRGMGLALVQRLATQQGGDTQVVESAQGACLRVRLRIAEPVA